MTTDFIPIEEALEELRQGRMIILVDDENRENEGDLVIAAEKITPDAINFMIKNGRGLLCLSLEEKQVNRLQLPMMAQNNTSNFHTAFTVSLEAATGVTTGVSTHDRTRTIKVAINPLSTPKDIVTPGHVFPLKAKAGGVLVRNGHTEGSVDLTKLAGLNPSGVICEILKEDGTMARLPDLIQFAKQHKLKLASINDLIAYRLKHDNLVTEMASSRLPIDPHGEFIIKIFKNQIDNLEHIALIKGNIDSTKPSLVRVHSECLTGDAFGSARCDCGWQLQASLETIAKQGGILLYMRQEGRGIGLANKILAYALQDQGRDTVEANHDLGFKADERDYKVGAQILSYLNIKKILLLTNNPEKVGSLKDYGIEIIERIPLEMPPTETTLTYLKTKRDKLGHLLTFK
jgi:3,4-dihydroxy 2-butanone 4-phosphate synthase/GTP cyclohydrolase II